MTGAPPPRRYLGLLLLSLALVTAIYLPGLKGPWLMDDDANLGMFTAYAAGAAPYAELIDGNQSGPLGRGVSMASFALNHALGLFGNEALKASNLALHLLNGGLMFWLCLTLFRIRQPLPGIAAPWAALGLTLWWLLLPMHISTVLYIVQRMTLLAGLFSLASCLFYVWGRQALGTAPRRGWPLLAVSLLLCFPLGLLAKESALATLPWLLLIELFFFRPALTARSGLGRTLAGLLLATLLLLLLCTAVFNLADGYLGREFTLGERLLTQGRVIWSYIHGIFLPDGSRMGLFNDDFTVSRDLLTPPTTMLALAGVGGLLAFAIRMADGKGWAVAFGIFFYFGGHLLESTVLSLELYFEHRNYLPSMGLLLAAAAAAARLRIMPRRLLLGCFAAYLGLLGVASFQRSQIWADKGLLLETSALSHPHSLRAWTDHPEFLLETGQPRLALEAALRSAESNPGYAGISYMQMISIYCRLRQPVPAELVRRTSQALLATDNVASTVTTPLSIGLSLIHTKHLQGHCPQTDFGPLRPAFIRLDDRLRQSYGARRGSLWFLRLSLAEWLLTLQQPADALVILRDTWRSGHPPDMPMVGLVLARTLLEESQSAEAAQVLAELAAVTHDAPADFRADMTALQQRATGAR